MMRLGVLGYGYRGPNPVRDLNGSHSDPLPRGLSPISITRSDSPELSMNQKARTG